jgi:TRAP-type C4-dicarboxylate transport system permease small subunit
MMQLVDGLSRGLSRLALALSGFGLLALVALLGWQVFARYVLGSSPAWSEQAALVVMVGFISLAAPVGVREGFHIGMTMAVDALPPAGQRVARVASMLVVAIFGVALGVYGGELALKTWSHSIPSLGIPRGAAYLPLAASGWLIVFFAFEQIVAAVRGKPVEPLWN